MQGHSDSTLSNFVNMIWPLNYHLTKLYLKAASAVTGSHLCKSNQLPSLIQSLAHFWQQQSFSQSPLVLGSKFLFRICFSPEFLINETEMWQSYHQLLKINDLDWNQIKVWIGVPVPARFLARDRKEPNRNFEPSPWSHQQRLIHPNKSGLDSKGNNWGHWGWCKLQCTSTSLSSTRIHGAKYSLHCSIRSIPTHEGMNGTQNLWFTKKTEVLSLGCKFRRNSGRSFCSVPDSGFFGPGCYNWGFATPIVFHWRTFIHRPISTAPNCKPSLIPSERAYQSFLSLLTSKRSRYRGCFSWVAFKFKNTTKNHLFFKKYIPKDLLYVSGE
jgi:hypothetical protein